MSLVLMMGNVGTGKTFYRKKNFNNGEIIICLDEHKGLSIEDSQHKLFTDLKEHLSNGSTVILDGNNLSEKARLTGLHFARKAETDVTVIDFGPGDETSLTRRLQDPRGLSTEYWKKIHYDNQKKYEKPELKEGIAKIICMY